MPPGYNSLRFPVGSLFSARGLRLVFRLLASSVATLFLWKSTRFHDKKTLDSQKNTRLKNQTYTRWKCPENALQCQP